VSRLVNDNACPFSRLFHPDTPCRIRGGNSGWTKDPVMANPFGSRLSAAVRAHSPFCLGVDPTPGLLVGWGLDDDAKGLARFCDIVLEALAGQGIVKPQSAYFERHGPAGVGVLADFCAAARRQGVLVILDVKRGDIGSTAEAYAQAYLSERAAIRADAITVLPYMGMGAIAPMVEVAAAAGAGLFVVVRSSNPEGRGLQTARTGDGRPVEEALIEEIGGLNASAPAGTLGSVGAVFAAMRGEAAGIDLHAMNGPFLVPGLGFQGGSYQEVGELFAGCTDRLVVSASRSVLAHGPDPETLGAEIADQRRQAFALTASPA
jgi:orotidine-5'-phosphate decarboxylase